LQNFGAVMRRCHRKGVAQSMDARARAILTKSAKDNGLGYSVDFQTLLRSKNAKARRRP